MKCFSSKSMTCSMIILSVLLAAHAALAVDPAEKKGWGINDPYNQLYDSKEFEKFKAQVVKVTEVVPMSGMSPATALEVREGSETSTTPSATPKKVPHRAKATVLTKARHIPGRDNKSGFTIPRIMRPSSGQGCSVMISKSAKHKAARARPMNIRLVFSMSGTTRR